MVVITAGDTVVIAAGVAGTIGAGDTGIGVGAADIGAGTRIAIGVTAATGERHAVTGLPLWAGQGSHDPCRSFGQEAEDQVVIFGPRFQEHQMSGVGNYFDPGIGHFGCE